MARDRKHPQMPKFPANSPRAGQGPKQPRVGEDVSSYALHPSWQFHSLDNGGPWCWSRLARDQVPGVLERLQSFESMRWDEILERDNHSIATHKLSPQAQKRLCELNQDDVDEVCSLRVTGRRRIVGIRDRGVLRILWWDPDHTVCISHKKHT